ncbi:MAG: 2Fe-2S iron-sulfur cluster binding domain-containing protein [Spirochaetales bacterium]|nr:MAG: 2Fe-2S iron-sulfur cluster binding domain-containing protein [Spirochaetales bacterium]
MSKMFTFTIDEKELEAKSGDTILDAADSAGIYIPRLCSMKGLVPQGACRVCTVMVNGRPQSACTQPATPGIIVENESDKLLEIRKTIIEMLFVEGNHICPLCEKSGNCELQALAYRFGIVAPSFPFFFPKREIDATHPDVFIDRNRCILCARCVRASRDLDGKHVFDFVGRGSERKIAVNAKTSLSETNLGSADKVIESCPVGAILRKRDAYAVPIGSRLYDKQPIGSDIEKKGARS